MLHEDRKVLIGFRLELAFDTSLNIGISCIFVDVSKTATVGLLLNNIIERFHIPRNSFLTVQNCKVLPSESVLVLLDVNSVKVNAPSSSTTEASRTQSSAVSQKENAPQGTNEVVSCNQDDVTDDTSIDEQVVSNKNNQSTNMNKSPTIAQIDRQPRAQQSLLLPNPDPLLELLQQLQTRLKGKNSRPLPENSLMQKLFDEAESLASELRSSSEQGQSGFSGAEMKIPAITENMSNGQSENTKNLSNCQPENEDKPVVSNTNKPSANVNNPSADMDEPSTNPQIRLQPHTQQSLSQEMQSLILQYQLEHRQLSKKQTKERILLVQNFDQQKQLLERPQTQATQPGSEQTSSPLANSMKIQRLQSTLQDEINILIQQHQLQHHELSEKQTKERLLLQQNFNQQQQAAHAASSQTGMRSSSEQIHSGEMASLDLQHELQRHQLNGKHEKELLLLQKNYSEQKQRQRTQATQPGSQQSIVESAKMLQLSVKYSEDFNRLRLQHQLECDELNEKQTEERLLLQQNFNKQQQAANKASSQTGMLPSSEQGQSGFSDGEMKIPEITKNLSNGQPENTENLSNGQPENTKNLSNGQPENKDTSVGDQVGSNTKKPFTNMNNSFSIVNKSSTNLKKGSARINKTSTGMLNHRQSGSQPSLLVSNLSTMNLNQLRTQAQQMLTPFPVNPNITSTPPQKGNSTENKPSSCTAGTQTIFTPGQSALPFVFTNPFEKTSISRPGQFGQQFVFSNPFGKTTMLWPGQSGVPFVFSNPFEKPKNSQPDDKGASGQLKITTTDDESSSQIRSCSDDPDSQKSTKETGQQSTSTANATSAKSQNNCNQEESHQPPQSFPSSPNGSFENVSSPLDFDDSAFVFVDLPSQSDTENVGNKLKQERVEKELVAPPMREKLETCMEDTERLADEQGDDISLKSPSSLEGIKNDELGASQLNQSTKESNESNPTSQSVKTEGNHDSGLEQTEASSEDCEFAKQVELDGKHIRFLKADGTWTVLTPEIADAELPRLDVPKENQSIVFQIPYLNQNFIYVPTELLYGRIVSYDANTDKLHLDIPGQFFGAIDEVSEADLLPITGSIYEVEFTTLLEPRIIS